MRKVGGHCCGWSRWLGRLSVLSDAVMVLREGNEVVGSSMPYGEGVYQTLEMNLCPG